MNSKVIVKKLSCLYAQKKKNSKFDEKEKKKINFKCW